MDITSRMNNLEKILKKVILIALLILLVVLVFYPLGDCEACRFDYGDKIVKADKIVQGYFDKCMGKDSPGSIIGLSNMSIKLS